MEIGDLNSDLYFKYANNIYIKKKGSTNEYIQFFDSEGNPNIKLKNPISAKDPYSTESSDGFYYYDNKLYIKIGNNVIDLSLQGSSLPEGSIIMYKGTSAPEGWSDYGGDTGISGVIYITNGNSTRDRITIELSIIGLNNNTATVGSEYTLQAIIKKDGQSYSNYNANEITYSTNDTEYATINGSKITPKKYKDGGVTISASIAESSVHTGASTSKTIVIARKTLNSFSFSTTLGEITAGSSLDLKNYITGLDNNLKNLLEFINVTNNLTINISQLSVGNYTIKAKFPGNDIYSACESSNTFSLTVKSSTLDQPNISFNGNEGHANARGEGISIPTLINPNNVPVTYSSSVTSVATVDDDGNIDVVGVGTTIITATFTGNDQYAPQSVSYILKILSTVATITKAPTGMTNLVENGTPQALIDDEGEASNGIIKYYVSNNKPSNTNGFYSTIPTATESGTYKVWYYAEGNGGYDDSSISGPIEVIISESQQEEDEITKSVNIATNSVYDEGGSSIDTENVKIIINDLRSDKTNNLLELLINVIGEPQVKISLSGLDLNNINGNALKGKTSVSYENETYTVIRVCDSTFQEGIIDSGGFYDVPNTGVTRGHLFKGGDCLTITILNNLGNSATITENTSSQSVSDKYIVVTVKNNTENDLVLNGIIKFHGSGLDTDNNIKFSNSNVVVNSGSIFTSVKIEIDTNYRGRTLDEIIIYDSNNTPIKIGDLNTTLQMGATYNIIYGEVKVNPTSIINFDDDIATHSWNLNNYIMDSAIDAFMVLNFNMGQGTHDDTDLAWESKGKEMRSNIVNASVITEFDPSYIYGTHYAKYVGYQYRNDLRYNTYVFSEVSEDVYNTNNDDNNDYYKLEGPFTGASSSLQDYLEVVRFIADNAARDPMYNLNRGRRIRPLGQVISGDNYPRNYINNSEAASVGDKWNSLFNGSLCAIVHPGEFTNDDYEVNKDAPTAYPSGHTCQSWTMAMLATQIKCNNGYNNFSNCLDFIRKCYRIGVYRTVERFHWNSDTLYGRLLATMIVPILNAITNLDKLYDSAVVGTKSGIIPSDVNYSYEFNNLLNKFTDIVDVSEDVEKYLWSMYSAANTVLNTSNHPFLSQDTYPEFYPLEGYDLYLNGEKKTFKYRGDTIEYYCGDTKLNIERKDIMQPWLMAMCLSELYCTNDDNTYTMGETCEESTLNIQTKLFAKAYELGGGRELDLYHEYRIDYDPTILRLAAGLVYATERGKYSSDTIRQLNGDHLILLNNINSTNTDTIKNSINSEIGCYAKNYSNSTFTVGYGVNSYFIFPDAPGPYNSNSLYHNLVRPFENKLIGTYTLLSQHLDESLFVVGGNTPSGECANPAIAINVRITNNTGSDILLNGDLKFTLGNPDRNGNYFGWEGAYNGTDHIFFSDSPVSFAVGETKIFYNARWVDPETGCGLGGKSPADAELLAISERPRNVLVYVLEPDGTANSEIVLCENMDSNIIFTEGETYDIICNYIS